MNICTLPLHLHQNESYCFDISTQNREISDDKILLYQPKDTSAFFMGLPNPLSQISLPRSFKAGNGISNITYRACCLVMPRLELQWFSACIFHLFWDIFNMSFLRHNHLCYLRFFHFSFIIINRAMCFLPFEWFIIPLFLLRTDNARRNVVLRTEVGFMYCIRSHSLTSADLQAAASSKPRSLAVHGQLLTPQFSLCYFHLYCSFI